MHAYLGTMQVVASVLNCLCSIFSISTTSAESSVGVGGGDTFTSR